MCFYWGSNPAVEGSETSAQGYSTRQIQSAMFIFVQTLFRKLFRKKRSKMDHTKIDTADLDSSCWGLSACGLRFVVSLLIRPESDFCMRVLVTVFLERVSLKRVFCVTLYNGHSFFKRLVSWHFLLFSNRFSFFFFCLMRRAFLLCTACPIGREQRQNNASAFT